MVSIGEVEVDVGADADDFDRQVVRMAQTARKHAEKILDDIDATVDLDLQTKAAQAQLTRIRKQIDDLDRDDVNLDIKVKNLLAEKARVEKTLSSLTATIEADADVAKAEAAIDAVARDRNVTLEVGVDRTVGSRLYSLGRTVSNTGTAFQNAGQQAEGFFDSLASMGRGAVRGLSSALQGALNIFGRLGTSLGKLGGSGGGAGGLAGLSIAAGTAVVGLSALANVITALAPLISGLVGAVAALAGSIGIALVGALLSVGPMLGAVAAGAGAVLIAFSEMSDEMNRAVRPVKNWFKEVRKSVQERLFAGMRDDLRQLGKVLRTQFTPLLEQSADAVNNFAESFIDTLDSGEMRRNIGIFRDTWPGILENLGSAFTGVFRGVSGIIAAISPTVEKITGSIKDAADAFGDWANSAEGQSSIRDFFDKAWTSAQALWEVIKGLGRALGAIFSAGQDTGDSLLTRMGDALNEWADWASSVPGQKELKNFFAGVEDTIDSVIGFIGDLKDVWDEWDTEENRQNLEQILQTLGSIIKFVGRLITELSDAWGQITDVTEEFGNAKNAASDFVDAVKEGDIEGALQAAEDGVKSLGQALLDAHKPMGAFLDELAKELTGGKDLGQLWQTTKVNLDDWFGIDINAIGDWVSDTWDAIKDAFGKWDWNDVFGSIGNVWDALMDSVFGGDEKAKGKGGGGITGRLDQSAQQIKDWITSLPEKISEWASGIDWSGILAGIFGGGKEKGGEGGEGMLSGWETQLSTWFTSLPEKVGTWLSGLGTTISTKFTQARITVMTTLAGWGAALAAWFGSLPAKVAGWLVSLGSTISSKFTQARTQAMGVLSVWLSTLAAWFGSLPGKVGGWLASLGAVVGTKFTQARSRATAVLGSWGASLASWFSSLPGKISGWLSSIASVVSNAFNQAKSSAVSAVAGLVKTVVGYFRGLPGQITGALAGVASAAYNAGRNIVQRLADGISSAIGSVTGAAARAAQAAKNALPWGSPAKEGPMSGAGWRDVRGAGENIVDQVAAGITGRGGAMQSALAGVLPANAGVRVPVAAYTNPAVIASASSTGPGAGAGGMSQMDMKQMVDDAFAGVTFVLSVDRRVLAKTAAEGMTDMRVWPVTGRRAQRAGIG